MSSQIGLSVYVSTFETQKTMLEDDINRNATVFTSFHIQEEWDENYTAKAKAMCRWLKAQGFRLIGDVSPKTLFIFQQSGLTAFAQEMQLDVIRIDYGFSTQEIVEISNCSPIALNASTLDEALISAVQERGKSEKIYAMHNFYPRPETGLDEEYFHQMNQRIKEIGVAPIAFIPGDEIRRGPLFEGLPTLERHRELPPYVAYLDLLVNFGVESIFVGDVALSAQQSALIGQYVRNQVISVPAKLSGPYRSLYHQPFTIRPDSPKRLMRLQESREYSCTGEKQAPDHCIERKRGAITMDNQLYQRYSGEVQILREGLPQDDRVNVIGQVEAAYEAILECIPNGGRIQLVELE